MSQLSPQSHIERPLIGLPGRRRTGASIADFPEVLAGLEVDIYPSDYARAVLAAGGLPVHLSTDAPAEAYVGRLDGLLLTGGADLDPALYDAVSETDLFPPEPARDEFEFGLLDAAAHAELPVLGVCRGLQLMNVHAGGSLYQHVPTHSRFDVLPATLAHAVDCAPGSAMARLYGSAIEVNSLHHQIVDRVGEGYRVTATAPDGTVEALESKSRPWLAVQWHPEMMLTSLADPIFGWLVEQARSGR